MKKVSKLDRSVKYTFTKEEKKAKISLKELKPFIREYKNFLPYVILDILLGIASIAIGILFPIYTGSLLASFTENFVAETSIKIGLIIMGLGISARLLEFIENHLWSYIVKSVSINLKRNLIIRINALSSSVYDKTGTSKFTSRIFNDIETVSSTPMEILAYISDTLTSIGFFIYTFSLNLYIGLFMLFYLLITILLRFAIANMKQRHSRVTMELNEKETSLEIENIRGMKDIRGLNTTDAIVDKINKMSIHNSSVGYKLNKKNFVAGFGAQVSTLVLNFLFILLCVYLIVDGQLALAGFMIAYNYRGNLQGFAYTIVNVKDYLNTCTLAAKRVNELYDNKAYPIETFGDIELEKVEGKVEFKNVSFEYEKDMQVLNNVSFTINPNSIVSFVGQSGTGKSTIVSLLNKLYPLDGASGEILLDGVNINDLTRNSLRDNICIVSQIPYIFDMSVADNLRLANDNATDSELEEVLKKAELYDFIMKHPKKLNTKLGENGIKLSGGQRQRLAIARALLKNTKVIVFDEATSSLDNENQAKIKNIMKDLSKDHTIIMIAHRLSTVVDSDNIIFIKDGSVYAEGNHQHLMDTCDEYKKLYQGNDTE